MKKLEFKVYRLITSIQLASNDFVYNIEQEALNNDFKEGLKYFYNYDIKAASEDYRYRVALTKKQCLEWSKDVRVTGYGKHSGKKLWQLPTRLKNQVSKMLTPVYIEY